MTYCRKQIQEDTNYIWDYVACLYHEGYHTGFESEMEIRMLEVLNS